MVDNIIEFKKPDKNAKPKDNIELMYECSKCGSLRFNLWCKGEVECIKCGTIVQNVRCFNPFEEPGED